MEHLICKRQHRSRDPKVPGDNGVTHFGLDLGNGYWGRRIDTPGGGANLAICHHRDGDVSNQPDFQLLLTNDQMLALSRGNPDHPTLVVPEAPVEDEGQPDGSIAGTITPAPGADQPPVVPPEPPPAREPTPEEKAAYEKAQQDAAPPEAPVAPVAPPAIQPPDTSVTETADIPTVPVAEPTPPPATP